MRIRTWLNAMELGATEQEITESSMTQPDMTMSLQDLLDRHTRGLDVPIFEGEYSDDEDDFYPDPRSLDLVEREELADYNAREINRLRELSSRKSDNEGNPPAAGEQSPLKIDPIAAESPERSEDL